MLDPVAVERAERSLDAFVNSRSKSRGKANETEAMWRLSERRHQEQRRRENRAAWYAHYDHMSQLHAALSEEHRVKAERLLVDPGEESGANANR
jgi:hypothetical protein